MSTPTTGRGGKSRIVIDMNNVQPPPPPGARRAGRGMRIFKIVALTLVVLLVVAALGGYLWWRGFRDSPQYSLALLVDAAQQNDMQEVERIMDADKVTENLMPQVVEKMTGSAALGAALANVIPQAAQAAPQFYAQIQPRVREVVREEVAREVKAFSERQGDKRVPFVLLAIGLKGMAEVKEEGDAANVSLSAQGHTMELVMARNGDRWKVVSIKNDELTSAITARIAPNIPAIIAQPTPTPTPRGRGRSGR